MRIAIVWTLGLCLLLPPTAAWSKGPPHASANAAAVTGETDEGAEQAPPVKEPIGKGPVSAQELRTILQSAPGQVTATALIVDAKTGQVILDLHGEQAVYIASVTKLFSTAAALRSKPADFHLTTEVRSSPIHAGSVDGLALIGGGDPSLANADLAQLADAVAAKGIKKIGKLVIDASIFDDKLPRGFEEKQTDAAFRAPVGGLQVDVSTLSVAVRPGKVGAAPLVEVLPICSDAVQITNQAKTIKGGRDTLAVVTRSLGRRTEIVVTGVVSANHKVVGSGRRRVSDSALFAGAVFRSALEKRGISVQGELVLAKADGKWTAVASHNSAELQKVVTTTNKISQNQYAESLYKLVGAWGGTGPSTAAKAETAVKAALAPLNIRWGKDGTIANGSGLYHAHKVSAQTVVDLLRGMAKDPAGPAWIASLAIGGKDGTLRGRMHDANTQGRVQAKTGTLDDVVGLAGFAQGPEQSYVFAMFFNQVRGGAAPYRAVHDRLLRRLLSP